MACWKNCVMRGRRRLIRHEDFRQETAMNSVKIVGGFAVRFFLFLSEKEEIQRSESNILI